jgi:Electron transfer DM13
MKLKNFLMLSLASLIIASGAKAISATENHPMMKSSNIPIVQLAQSQQTTKQIGTFVSGEHKTQGTASITTNKRNSFLTLDNSFKTSDSGPDLVVILHRSDDVIGSTKPPAYSLKKGDYVILGRLQKFSGAQTYAIPKNIDLANYKSAAIWCRKFNATFGAAKLSNS